MYVPADGQACVTEEPEPADPSPKTQPNLYGPASPLAEATNLTVSLTTGAFGVKMKLVERTGGVPPVTGTVFRRHPQPSGLLAQSIAPEMELVVFVQSPAGHQTQFIL